jgi:uncharacterized membrane protein
MRRRRKTRRAFGWGMAVGVGVGAVVWLVPELIGRARRSHIVRLQKSIQIGAPAAEVFERWMNLQNLPRVSSDVREVQKQGQFSHWKVGMGGANLEWDAEIEQLIPNQAIAWKSVSGPKHTGRITFSPIENDTLVQVTMNYAPPLRLFLPFVAPMTGRIEGVIERVLRDFKASAEGRGSGQQRMPSQKVGPGTSMSQSNIARATGTNDATSEKVDRFGNRANPVEYTRPPEAKY